MGDCGFEHCRGSGSSPGYLRVHWLSDVVAGILVGIAAALTAAWATLVVVDLQGRRAHRRASGAGN